MDWTIGLSFGPFFGLFLGLNFGRFFKGRGAVGGRKFPLGGVGG